MGAQCSSDDPDIIAPPPLVRSKSVDALAQQLADMGWDRGHCYMAIDAMGADVAPKDAAQWCTQWMLDNPLDTKTAVEIVMAPGFPRQKSEEALRKTDGNVQGAVELLFEEYEEEQRKEAELKAKALAEQKNDEITSDAKFTEYYQTVCEAIIRLEKAEERMGVELDDKALCKCKIKAIQAAAKLEAKTQPARVQKKVSKRRRSRSRSKSPVGRGKGSGSGRGGGGGGGNWTCKCGVSNNKPRDKNCYMCDAPRYDPEEMKKQAAEREEKDREELNEIFGFLYQKLKAFDEYEGKGAKTSESCKVCWLEFDDETKAITMNNCGHSIICEMCFHDYLENKSTSGDVLPYIGCPDEGCFEPLAPNNFTQSGLSTKALYTIARIHMQKLMKRSEDYVPCRSDACPYGFLVEGPDDTKVQVTCPVCEQKQEAHKKKVDVDAEFQKMLDEGKLRECPKCKALAMKDYGMCNVMNCQSCGIWWNWRTRDTATSASKLKQQARNNGTLWEPGELAFQQNLQRDNLPEFIALLERNGIKYDPNYSRGSG